MTEQQWLSSLDPVAMLAFLTGKRVRGGFGADPQEPPSDRKLRLFACAAWRLRANRFVKARDRQHQDRIADYGEALADGLPLPLDRPFPAMDPDNDFLPLRQDAGEAARRMTLNRLVPNESPAQAALLRDLFGNPFREVVVYSWYANLRPPADSPNSRKLHFRHEWRTPTVLSLAQAAYEERLTVKCGRCVDGVVRWLPGGRRSPDGVCPYCHGAGTLATAHLDPDRLAVLADALEEAGCTEEAILRHLHGFEVCPDCMLPTPSEAEYGGGVYWCPGCGGTENDSPNAYWSRLRGPHIRGCWAVDLLLGKD